MHRKLAVFVLFLSSMFSLRSLAENGEPEPEQLTVAIYNDAGIPADVLHRAEQRATSIFSQASLEVGWIHCLRPKAEDAMACRQTDRAEYLALRIIHNPVKSSSD